MHTDILVIGSGIAGLAYALKCARFADVTVITKTRRDESNTRYAQGGIAAVLSENDSVDAHARDTIAAGDGLCDERVVTEIVSDGNRAVMELESWGVHFTRKDDGTLDLGREGGHSARRIAHASDFTGREVETALLARAEQDPGITILENRVAVDLITAGKIENGAGKENRCFGAYVMDKETGAITPCSAGITVLATGGAGKVYLYTSNPDIATGDGIAMAYRANAVIANMEFVQFHPTCLFHPAAKNFLISEAVRGEGAVLTTLDGTAFMKRYHPDGELAPRDVVARAIDNEMKTRGDNCVLLDISHRDESFISRRFPNISTQCREYGYEMTREPLPVVPAAHYTCGGVKTGIDGRTAIDGLLAIGETACTGLHGANRLASNSLLEALVMADKASSSTESYLSDAVGKRTPRIPPWETGTATTSDEPVVVNHDWEEVRRLMWNYVGIVRTEKRLKRALHRIELISREIQQYYWDFLVTPDLVELRNIATVSELIIRSALARRESRGLHYLTDHPGRDDQRFRHDTLLHAGL